MPRKIDYEGLIGTRVGRLVVKEYLGIQVTSSGKNKSIYLCICDCGKEVVVPRDQLISGHKTSCGKCIHIEMEGPDYRYYCRNGDSFVFSSEDLERIKKLHVYINKGGYPCTKVNGKKRLLTHYLLNVDENTIVDHVDGDPRNERRSNLRIATGSQNMFNGRLRSSNSSGYKGVSYFPSRRKYRATIKIAYKQIHLGYYDNPEDAARAYDTAARFYFGEFACVNFPRCGEQGCLYKQTNQEQVA